jgi:DNA-binding transcriptional LysR family regulator
MPKSTLSRQVSRLEERLGARLLQRTTRRLSLTETGTAYFARCRDAIDALEEAERVAQDVSGQARGTLKVSTSFDFARDHLAPLLPAFTRQHPAVDVNVVMSQERVDMLAEGFDVAVRGGVLDDSGFVSRKLGESNVWLCATPQYLDEHGRPAAVAELAEHAALVMTRGGEDIPWRMEGPTGPQRLPLQARIRANEWGFLRIAVLEGLGIGLLLANDATQLISEGRLERVLPEYALGGGGLYAVYPSRHHLSPKVRVFVDFLAEHVDGYRS